MALTEKSSTVVSANKTLNLDAGNTIKVMINDKEDKTFTYTVPSGKQLVINIFLNGKLMNPV